MRNRAVVGVLALALVACGIAAAATRPSGGAVEGEEPVTASPGDGLPRIRETYEYETLRGIGGYVVREGPCFYFGWGKDRVLMLFYSNEMVHGYDKAGDRLLYNGRELPYETYIVSNYSAFTMPPQHEWATALLVPPDPSCDTSRAGVMSKSFTIQTAEEVAWANGGGRDDFVESSERLAAGHDQRLLQMVEPNPRTGAPDVRLDGEPLTQLAGVMQFVVSENAAAMRMAAFAKHSTEGDKWASGYRLKYPVKIDDGLPISGLVIWGRGVAGKPIRIDLLRDTAPIDHFLANAEVEMDIAFSIDPY